MNIICNPIDCTGCSACESSCAAHAVTMEYSEEGFLYPHIDAAKCVNCGLCAKVCPNNQIAEAHQPEAYLAWIKDKDIRFESSSGGIFSAVAMEVIRRGGIVCGAAYDKDMIVRHIAVDNIEGLAILRGSKYTQSIVGDIYGQVRLALNADRWVYFVGTPCQVAGLRNFLRKDYEKLIASDVICHGIPSGLLLKEQISALERRFSSKIDGFNFRAKLRMGQTQDVAITLRKQSGTQDAATICLNFETLPYCYGFRRNTIIRESCYRCLYAKVQRVGDITLGDFWNVKTWFPDVKRSPGCSLILVSTDKGREMLQAISNQIVLRETTIEAAISKQAQLKAPLKRPAERDQYRSYKEFNHYCQTFLKPPFKYRFKKHLVNFAKIVTLFKYRY